jgi:predicted naringenin-chalcone synthase
MSVYVHRIETLLPPFAYRQDYARDRMAAWLPGRRTQRLIRGIYDHSGIETRYSVLPDFGPGAAPVLFQEDASGHMREPSTRARNDCFAEWSRRLSVEVARNVLVHARGFEARDVTHVVTVSCTGFRNPGPDYDIVRALGLSPGVERYHLGFMGCYAALPALRMARQFCLARPDSVVLVVCLELCSLHLQFRQEPDSLLANALFADGAAAAVVSARPPDGSAAAFELHGFSSSLAPEGSGDMAWTIGDRGFDIRLSTYVPDIIAANIGGIVRDALAAGPWGAGDIRTWAVHPGGRSILDKVELALGLAPDQLAASRSVLRECGNMSSATILFVLRRILEGPGADASHPVCAMAFGPGLTIETALLDRIPPRRPPEATEVPGYVAQTVA